MIMTGMLVTLVAIAFGRLAYGLILPFMRTGLGLSYQQAGNLGTASALGYFCFVMLAGMLAARRGGRATILLGTSLMTIGFAGLSAAENYSLLLALMLLLGFGTAFAFTPVISLLASWFPARRGAVIGTTNSGIGLGMVLAGALVPYLSSAYEVNGWRITWMIFAAVAASTTLAVFAFLRNPPVQGASTVHARVVPGQVSVYKNRHVITVGLLYGVVGLTYITQAIFMYSFALESGVPALTAGRLTAVLGVLSIFASPSWGWLSDRFGRAPTLTTAVSLTLVGTLIPVIWPTLPGFVLHYVIVGCTVSGMFTSILAASSESVQPHQAPLAVSFVTLFYAAGQFIGPALSGLIIEYTGDFRPAFAISCLIMSGGIYLSWQLRKLGKERQSV